VIWLDIGDLLWWPLKHVSGIQRVMLCVLSEIRANPPTGRQIRFCEYAEGIGWVEPNEAEVAGCMATLDHGDEKEPGALFQAACPEPTPGSAVRGLGSTLKVGTWRTLRWFYRHLPAAIEPESRDLFFAALRWTRALRALLRPAASAGPALEAVACAIQPGDLLLNIGSGWRQPAYTPALAALKDKVGFRYVVLIYDVIPWKLSDIFEEDVRQPFIEWASATMGIADRIMTISEHSRKDILEFVSSFGLARKPIDVIRLGQSPIESANGRVSLGRRFERDPAGFVLCVGTIARSKNQALLFNVWRELLKRRGPAEIPCLVWAGRDGRMMDDLLGEIERERWLDGKLVWLKQTDDHGVSEEELDRLYRGCLFTVFPSIYEGWGLPVAESLAHGKLCIASNAASIPEVGGDLLDYHAPEDFQACLQLVERAIYDHGYRRSKESEIRARYHPADWQACTKAILANCAKVVEPGGGV
jgi:glycosyltransferase involved in cell wall biosynthesis